MNPVTITVTSRQLGTGPVVPYSHRDRLQYFSAGLNVGRPVVYLVPIYELRVESGFSYPVIRFALHNRGNNETPQTRPCDSGLHEARMCTPSWLPNYSPHSFRGSSRAGAWQLLPGKGFLIHEGANRYAQEVGGSIGCIEVLDGRWNGFLGELERLAGGPCHLIAANRMLTVKLEAAPYPRAVLQLSGNPSLFP
jgi:hypothetical protein